jgi:hypothetical protein
MLFLKVSLVFVILVSATTTKCLSAGAENIELATIRMQTSHIWDIDHDDENETVTFRLAIGGYDDRFRAHTSLVWENLTLDRVKEKIVLNSSSYGPTFDDFCKLLTDGDNMFVEKWIESIRPFGQHGYSIGPGGFEQAMFENQTGCINGIDLQGNYIDSITFTIEDFQSTYYPPPHEDWSTKLNLSLVFRGRPLFPDELALAVVRPQPQRYKFARVINNSTLVTLTALRHNTQGLRRPFSRYDRWAMVEFMIDWNTAVVGEQISSVREYGTHNIRELITDGDDWYLEVHLTRSGTHRYRESDFFRGQPGCFNGVDLEGNYVQDVSLVLEEGSKYEARGTDQETATVIPRFVFSGSLGDGPIVCPDCECESECDDGLPEHNLATTVKILVMLTGWAWFLM